MCPGRREDRPADVAMRQHAREMEAGRVRSLGGVSERGPGLVGEAGRQRPNLGEPGMSQRDLPEDDACLGRVPQRGRDRLVGRVRRLEQAFQLGDQVLVLQVRRGFEPVLVARSIDEGHARAGHRGLSHAVRQKRHLLAQVRADDEDRIGGLDVLYRASEARADGVEFLLPKIASAQPMIDAVGAEVPRDPRQQVALLGRRAR